ncbi:DNRLRE domain-containing protein [Nocardiopsis ganjiahuensis]|uniref:DNRLRE domain-containing protein n=1 Tax=Nocardiopsis ganjiahuensis TaxID=239984 RepID=UPI000684845E|nr:DNRLRE domain-containing protein [Nocardiopsis ganjiahuensis]
MRRSLSRATAACAAYTLALALGGAAPATAEEEALSATGGTAVSGDRSGTRDGSAPTGEGRGTPSGTDGASADAPATPGSPGGGRAEAGSSLWTYVDRAFPDRPHSGTETASVGTGRLVWDRVYTRRALFRFPVDLDPDTAVDSAVLRVEVAWSYDCGSDSFVQLHRVDPFHAGTTWNDQPAARALIDTRNVRGGRAACPVGGGVEFDVTEAYQWALDHGEPHLHLRLGERDESGSTAWRRFDVEDVPPVLVVDHSRPPAPDTGTDPNGSRDAVEDAGTHADHRTAHHEASSGPVPLRSTQTPGLSGDTVLRAGETDEARVQDPASDGRPRTEGERARSQGKERVDRPLPPDDRRRETGDTAPRPRGPPAVTLIGRHSPRFTDRGKPVGGRSPNFRCGIRPGDGTRRRRPEAVGRAAPRAPMAGGALKRSRSRVTTAPAAGRSGQAR